MDLLGFFRSDLFYLLIDASFIFLFFLAMALHGSNLVGVSVYAMIALALKLVVFVGMRPFEAGNDTIGYYHTFQLLEGVATAREVGGGYGGTELAGELLYWPFAALIKPLIGESFRFFLVLSILISCYLTYLGNKKLAEFDGQLEAKGFALSVIMTYLVFLSFEIAYFGGHIRSAFGIPLALLSYCLVVRRKPIAASLVLFLALGFHNSAISILPLLLIEFVMPKVHQSGRLTFLIILVLFFAFIFGRLDGLSALFDLVGGYYSDRYMAYVEYEGFNISSVFATVYFWIILMHIVFFLILGYQRIHFYAFYYVGLILLFSSTPKISERFFAYILVCLPLLLYLSLRTRLNKESSLIITVVVSVVLSPLVVTSNAVSSSLSIPSYIYPR